VADIVRRAKLGYWLCSAIVMVASLYKRWVVAHRYMIGEHSLTLRAGYCTGKDGG